MYTIAPYRDNTHGNNHLFQGNLGETHFHIGTPITAPAMKTTTV